MRCREVAEHTGAFVDGEVSVTTRWRIRLHLSQCADCARFVRQIALTRRTLRRAAPEPLDHAREDALVDALRSAPGSASHRPP